MAYSSLKYIGFVLLAMLAYAVCPKRLRYLVLLAFSAAFIALAGGAASLCFIYGSALLTYGAARLTGDGGKRAAVGTGCVILIAAALTVFKYGEYSLRLFSSVPGLAELGGLTGAGSVVVPLGISFYSLQLIAYLVDVRRGVVPAERDFLKFALYVSWFPHIMQGPIARYKELGSTLYSGAPLEYDRTASGAQLALWGMAKKLIIADRAKIVVDAVYASYNDYGGAMIVLATVLYALQLYADFSGCVDISLGVSEIFGIRLGRNFAQPYLATSISELWKRWHISLSTWLRDYIYIPLGGNRRGKLRKYCNLMLTFALSGMWHGVGLNYLFWGLLHGTYQIIGQLTTPARERLAARLHIDRGCLPVHILRTLITFLLTDFAYLFFRANGLRTALDMARRAIAAPELRSLLDGTVFTLGLGRAEALLLLVWLLIMVAVDILHECGLELRRRVAGWPLPVRWTLYLGLIFAVLIFGKYGYGYNSADFIYMRF